MLDPQAVWNEHSIISIVPNSVSSLRPDELINYKIIVQLDNEYDYILNIQNHPLFLIHWIINIIIDSQEWCVEVFAPDIEPIHWH